MKIWNWLKNLFKKAPAPSTPVVVVPPKEPLPEMPTSANQDLMLIIVKDSMRVELAETCDLIRRNRERYQYVEAITNVPWDVIAACHYRESSLSFKGVLHNGEYIIGTGKKTKLVPAGRGPFSTWEEAAIDAIMIEKGKLPALWNTAGKLDFCEKYNGLGYRNKGIPSPYVYAGTNKYVSGMYVADGKFSATAVDKRLGCAAIIKGLN